MFSENKACKVLLVKRVKRFEYLYLTLHIHFIDHYLNMGHIQVIALIALKMIALKICHRTMAQLSKRKNKAL